MPRFGITGHINLTPVSETIVQRALGERLAPYAGPSLIGVSCLARGSDAIFARVVLDLGGEVEAVVPALDYPSTLDNGYAASYRELLGRARHVWTMPFAVSGRDAYDAANRVLIQSRLDRLYAVWDGHPDDRPGSTASAVALARELGVPIEVTWPAGAERRP